MPQQDFLYLVTERSPLEIMKLFLQVFESPPAIQRHCFEGWCDDYCDFEDFVLITNIAHSWEVEDIVENYGIIPTVILEMSDHKKDRIKAIQQELTGIVHLLKTIDSDMVFETERHGDVLLRKAGQLLVRTETWHFKEPEFLKLIDLPYEVRDRLMITPEDQA